MSEHVVQLPSGLTIVVEPMISTRTAAIGVWVGVGARDESPEQSGISHFLEHLLFKGTESRSAIDVSQAIDRVGGDINAFTSKEYTAYYCRLPARHSLHRHRAARRCPDCTGTARRRTSRASDR